MNHPRAPNQEVTIVMATYNGEQFLEAQLNSILSQTYKKWQLLIRDDGSSDNTVSILKKYSIADNRIRLMIDTDGNLGFNRNFLRLISSAANEYISICDQDDVWLPEKLARCLEKLKEIETDAKIPALVHCDAMIVDVNLNLVSEKWIGKRGKISGINGLVFANSVQGAATIFNASLKKLVLERKADLPYDYHLALLAAFNGQRYYIEQPLLKYRQHTQNAIGALDIKQKFNIKYYLGQMIDVIKKTFDALKFDKLAYSLQFCIFAYPKIKYDYAIPPILNDNVQPLKEYLYIFEGKNRFKKIFIYLKGHYAFSRRKDYLIFLLLLIANRDLKNPQSW